MNIFTVTWNKKTALFAKNHLNKRQYSNRLEFCEQKKLEKSLETVSWSNGPYYFQTKVNQPDFLILWIFFSFYGTDRFVVLPANIKKVPDIKMTTIAFLVLMKN